MKMTIRLNSLYFNLTKYLKILVNVCFIYIIVNVITYIILKIKFYIYFIICYNLWNLIFLKSIKFMYILKYNNILCNYKYKYKY